MSLSVGIVGARKAVQGIGAYVARAFRSAGCEVTGIVGTSPASIEAARNELRALHGIEAAGFTDVHALLAERRPDILAICSPTAVHRPALQAALAARVHVLCDKPLWWEDETARTPPAELAAQVRRLARGFADAGRLLELNAQWPVTLPAFHALHPHAAAGASAPQSVEMLLSPITRGTAMVVDAAPHLISLLHAVAGPGHVEEARVEGEDEALSLAFTWRHARGATRASLALRRCATQPRPAGYALDGCWAERRVSLPGYAMELVSEGRSVPLPDPLDAHVAAYVARVLSGAATDVEALVESLTTLRDLVAAAEVRRAGARRSDGAPSA
jgi:predicted dehydrogenase